MTFVTFFSTVFFFFVPALARRRPTAGRLMLRATGTLNTLICMWAFGEPSGVALFLAPCILLGVLLFRPHERLAMAFSGALPMAVFLIFHGRLGAPLHAFTAGEYASLVSLHAVSVGALTAFIGYQFSSRVGAA